jgi:GDP-L-fucose synthase
MNKILLIGGNGFLGNNLKEYAKDIQFDAPRSSELNFLTKKGFEKYCKGYDTVIYMAADYGGLKYNIDNRLKMMFSNTEMTTNFFHFINELQPKRTITFGSACAYPANKALMKEDEIYEGEVHPSVNEYGNIKRMLVWGSKTFQKECGIEWDHLSLANMYGPYDVYDLDRSHIVGALITKFMMPGGSVQLMGTGIARRDLIYVKDVCDAIVKVINNRPSNQIINIGSGGSMLIKDLVDLIHEMTDPKKNVKWGNPDENGSLEKSLDVTRAKELLNWSPTTSLRDGLAETIKWYQNSVK